MTDIDDVIAAMDRGDYDDAAGFDDLRLRQDLAAARGPRRPAPDPSQGRGSGSAGGDFRHADHAALAAELAKYGLKPRSQS